MSGVQTRDALQQLADTLTAAGVPTAIDPRDVNVPGGWLQRQTVLDNLLGEDCYTLRVRLLLIAPNVGTWDALGHLDTMLEAARSVLAPNTGTGTTDTVALLPDDVARYPGVYYDVDVEVTPDGDPNPQPEIDT